jgi:YfiH family protein
MTPAADVDPVLPEVPEAFVWTRESWGSALRCRPLQEIAAHLFTTRQLVLTEEANLRRLASALGAERVKLVTQVHRAGVAVVRRGEQASDERPEADVIVSDDPAVAIAVRAADCVPILLADPATGAVGAVHAGWRGTAAGAVGAAVEAMVREFGSDPGRLIAAIGPSIGSCCYEVGSELVDAFAAAGHERYLIDRWFLTRPPGRANRERSPLHLDVAGANRDQLILAGVPEQNIYLSGLCTAMNLDVLTSFRYEGNGAGRIAGAIVARLVNEQSTINNHD